MEAHLYSIMATEILGWQLEESGGEKKYLVGEDYEVNYYSWNPLHSTQSLQELIIGMALKGFVYKQISTKKQHRCKFYKALKDKTTYTASESLAIAVFQAAAQAVDCKLVILT